MALRRPAVPDAGDLVAQVLADHAVEAVGLTLRDHVWRCRCGDGRETPTGWLASADEARAHQARAVVAALHGWHPHYLSTACLHARDEHRDEVERAYLHRRCQLDAKRFDGSRKVGGTCKWCQAPCRCECHRPNVDPAGLAMDDLTDDERAALVAYGDSPTDCDCGCNVADALSDELWNLSHLREIDGNDLYVLDWPLNTCADRLARVVSRALGWPDTKESDDA
jgi:hypothetical protein